MPRHPGITRCSLTRLSNVLMLVGLWITPQPGTMGTLSVTTFAAVTSDAGYGNRTIKHSERKETSLAGPSNHEDLGTAFLPGVYRDIV